MPTKTFAALMLCLAACGTPVAAPPTEQLIGTSADELTSPQRTLRLSASDTRPDFKKNFTIATTPDLFVAFDYHSKSPGSHKATFEILAPSGILYQTTDVPFVVTQHAARVWNSLPVAGTWVEQYSMSGTWQVQVYLDDASDPAASTTFVLQ